MERIDIEIIVLAAGLSKRMGTENKLLLSIEGEPMVRRSVRQYLSISPNVTVVLGHEAYQVMDVLRDLDVAFIINPNFSDGQQTTVSCGLKQVKAHGDAVMIGLADQPLLDNNDLSALVEAFAISGMQKIMIPFFNDERGNPVILPATIARDLKEDPANPACRGFIDRNPQLIERYKAPNDHFTTDIDTPLQAAHLGIKTE